MRIFFMTLLTTMRENFEKVIYSAPNFVQFLFSLKIIWIGAGGLSGVQFLVRDLNYLIQAPMNSVLVLLGIMGVTSVLFNKYLFSFVFAIFNVFLFASISLTFLLHSGEFPSISGGIYILDTLATVWLVFRIQSDRTKFLFGKFFKR